LGIRVDQVQLKNVNPPSQVQASFNQVNRAQQDRENAINIANEFGQLARLLTRATLQSEKRLPFSRGCF
jgi:modulator of FtsH protease HflK